METLEEENGILEIRVFFGGFVGVEGPVYLSSVLFWVWKEVVLKQELKKERRKKTRERERKKEVGRKREWEMSWRLTG